MKKIILIFTLISAFAMVYGYKQSEQNGIAEKNVKQVTAKDVKVINKPDVSESGLKSYKSNKASEGRPRILFILSNDKGQAAWSPSLWWSYQHTTSGQPGC
jgi:hypothetical protein